MRAHRIRWDALVGGIFFAIVAIAWFAAQNDWIVLSGDVRLILPVVLIVAGIAGILATLRATNSKTSDPAVGPTEGANDE